MKSLETYLFQRDYTRSIFCPYTPIKNGVVERKNRHIVKVGLAMLMRYGVPMIY